MPRPSTQVGVRTRASARAAFTLIEVVIVIAILGAIAGIAWPAVRGAWREQSFASAVEIVAHALSGARLDAVRRGEVLVAEIETRPTGGQAIVVRSLGPADASGDPNAASAVDAEEFRVAEPLGLPAGMRIEPPVEDEEEALASGAAGFAAPPPPAMTEAPPPLVVATFFPDGSAAAGGALVLADDHGRRARVEVGVVTGAVRLVRADVRDEGAGEDGAPAPPIAPDAAEPRP